MKTIEIKIDKFTLPNEGQRVDWQTHEDANDGQWKSGIFSSNEDGSGNLFCVGFEPTSKQWDDAFNVLKWRCHDCKGSGYDSYPNHSTTQAVCTTCSQ